MRMVRSFDVFYHQKKEKEIFFMGLCEDQFHAEFIFFFIDGDNGDAAGEDNADDNDRNDGDDNDDDGGDADNSGDDTAEYDPNDDINGSDLSEDFSISDMDDLEILFS